MSIRLMSAVWESEQPWSGSKLLVMLALADYANDEGYCWPSVATIARKCRLSERQAQRLIHELADEETIAIVRPGDGRGHTPLYYLKGVMDVTLTREKGDTVSPLPEKRVTSRAKRVTSRARKGDIAMSPDPLVDPSLKQPSVKSADLDGSRAAPAAQSNTQAQPPAVNGFGTRLDDPRISTEDCPSRLQANSYQQPARDPAQPPPSSTYFDPRKLRNGTIEPGAGTTAVEIVLEYVPFNANTFSSFVCRTITEQVTDFAKWRDVMAKTTLKGFAPHNIADRLEIYANGWKARPETGKLLREPTNDNRNQLSAAAEADLREQLRARRAAAAARNAALANPRPISPA